MGNPRTREWISRGSPDRTQCGTCGDSTFSHDLKVKRVAGEHLRLCVTCRIEFSHGRLAEHLAMKDRNQPTADVNTDVIENIRSDTDRGN